MAHRSHGTSTDEITDLAANLYLQTTDEVAVGLAPTEARSSVGQDAGNCYLNASLWDVDVFESSTDEKLAEADSDQEGGSSRPSDQRATNFHSEVLEDAGDHKISCSVKSKKLKKNRSATRWPQGIVHYEISDGLKAEQNIHDELNKALEKFRAQVDEKYVKWVPRTANERSYVEFVFDSTGCTSSEVGCKGRKQEIKLANWAKCHDILHEMGHAIGLCHEHSRLDRAENGVNAFVAVYNNNTKTHEQVDNVDYDIDLESEPVGKFNYTSLLHYPPGCIEVTENDITYYKIVKVPSQGKYCPTVEFSNEDIKGIEYVYGQFGCPYDVFGDDHKLLLRNVYECHTCWKASNELYICRYCAFVHHNRCADTKQPKPHPIQQNLSTDRPCVCGKNEHKNNVCSFNATGKQPVKQQLFHCKCLGEDRRCCFQCMKTCHNEAEWPGHKIHFCENHGDTWYCECGDQCKIRLT